MFSLSSLPHRVCCVLYWYVTCQHLCERILADTGRYLAGSFLSEENKIMIELKQAAEKRSAEERPRSQKHANAPFGWILPPMRRDW